MCVLTSTVESADPEPAPQPEVAAPPQVEETPAPTLTPPPPPPQQPEVNSSKGRVNSCCTHCTDELAVDTQTHTYTHCNFSELSEFHQNVLIFVLVVLWF